MVLSRLVPMAYPLIKLLLTALIIVLVSEISKRSTFLGALLASLPLVSLLAMVWLYIDTRDTEKIIHFSYGVFWLVLPSLTLFLVLPLLLRAGWSFPLSLVTSIVLMSGCYLGLAALLKRYGILI